MAFESLGKPRYTLEESLDGLVVRISSDESTFRTAFIGFWLVGWALGEFFAIVMLFGGLLAAGFGVLPDEMNTGAASAGGFFLLIWLCLWTIGGAWALQAFLWGLKGYERLSISADRLRIEKNIPFWRQSADYRRADVVSLRVASFPSWLRATEADAWGEKGKLAFDYGARTVHFGIGLEDAEAKQLLRELLARYPALGRDADDEG